MKELTIKEKAQRYDEAIKKLHEIITMDNKPVNPKEIGAYLFPELAESEDEKIRKGIIRNLEYLMDRAEGFVKDELKERIAWLEKIGKNTTNNGESNLLTHERAMENSPFMRSGFENEDKVEPKFKVGDIIKSKKNGDTVKVEQILSDSYCYSGWDGAATCYCDFSISEQDNWELVEQKPVENSAKVSESSTEEKDMGEYKKGFECGKQRVLKYPEDFGLCKKSAWSEEDEINLEKAIWYVENPAPMVVKDSMLVEWLKSLKDRYAWKPSDEQMAALLVAVGDEKKLGSDVGKELYELYLQLKQL